MRASFALVFAVAVAIGGTAAFAAPAAAAEPPAVLRHVEYDVTTRVDGDDVITHLAVDLVATTADRGCIWRVADSGDIEPMRVTVDRYGVAHVDAGHVLTRAESLLVYFFALSAQNTTGMGRGDTWDADGGATRYRVVSAPGDGQLDLAVERTTAGTTWLGRLLYDTHKVVPVRVDLHDDAHDMRVALTLTADSQP